ncbi:MAG: GHKL domain-containing protein [Saprospiraceae bacterium]|nr:GHKL domain-containing protein [Saprospiraceae bacterium]MCB9318356.1 GHKL domain-containing protein [Lewinellaceae bacterium]
MFQHFKVKVVSFLIAILILILLFTYLWQRDGLKMHLMLFIPLTGILIWRLFRLVDKTNSEVATFLSNIRYNDYAVSYPENKNVQDSYQDLHSAFNLVNEKFRNIRSEKEAQFQYLQAIVENVDAGLICFEQNGKTVLMNKGIQQLLHKSYFPNFSAVERYNVNLYDALQNIQPGEKKLVKLVIENQIKQIAIRKTILKLRDEPLHLFALQNIHAELEQQEVDSWQKLIRILTHEIMNSITPVVSLAAMTNEMLNSDSLEEANVQEDIRKSIQTIERRSNGLLHFTETYRQLTKIPPPKFQQIDPTNLLDQTFVLFTKDIQERHITIEKRYPTYPVTALMDPDLMEQVFINLIKNALEAMTKTDDPVLQVAIIKNSQGAVEISILDNGSGISDSLADQIFVPFFTTKKNGSGIGLSLSRQIVQMHKGHIFATSIPGQGTCFTIQI